MSDLPIPSCLPRAGAGAIVEVGATFGGMSRHPAIPAAAASSQVRRVAA